MGPGDRIQQEIRERDAHLPADQLCPVHGGQWKVGRNTANAPTGRYCGWDGSMHPDDFMAYITKPGTELGPTDKNYKVYITVSAADAGEDPDEMRVITKTNRDERPGDADGFEWSREWMTYEDAVGRHPELREEYENYLQWIENTTAPSHPMRTELGWVQVSPRGEQRESKFYFEHLSEDQKKEFVELLNAKKLNVGYPGHFYRLPFFISSDPS